jgi:hypothetical protein
MGTEYDATNVASGVMQQSTINQELQDIQVGLERSLSIHGDSTNGDNAMQADLDMNSQSILNADRGDFAQLRIGGQVVFPGPHSGLGVPVDLTGIQDGDTLVWSEDLSILIPLSQVPAPASAFGCLNTLGYTGDFANVNTAGVTSPGTQVAAVFSEDGLRMFTVDTQSSTFTFRKYALPAPYVLGGLTVAQNASVSTVAGGTNGLAISSEGSRAYFLTGNTVESHLLFGPFDIASTTFESILPPLDGVTLEAFKVSNLGDKMYTLGQTGTIAEYTTLSPHQPAGAVLENSFDAAAIYGAGVPKGFVLRGKGLYILVKLPSGDAVIYQFELATPGSLAGAIVLVAGTGLPYIVEGSPDSAEAIWASEDLQHFMVSTGYPIAGDARVHRYATTLIGSCP